MLEFNEIKYKFRIEKKVENVVMIIANEIFDYFDDKGEKITYLKLRLLVYYCCSYKYAYSSSHFNNVVIPFKAWVSGPVNENLHRKLCTNNDELAIINKFDLKVKANKKNKLCNDDLEIIRDVLDAYGDLSGTSLLTLSCSESPWINSRVGLFECANSVDDIDYENIRDEYIKNLD